MKALVPRRLGERLRQAADIRLIEPPFVAPPLREKLIWSPRFTASAAHAWLRSRLAEVAAREGIAYSVQITPRYTGTDADAIHHIFAVLFLRTPS